MGRRHYRGVADSLIFGNSAARPTLDRPIRRINNARDRVAMLVTRLISTNL